MSTNHESLERTCKRFLDSLLTGTNRHTLCLNIAEPGFSVEQLAADYVKSKDGSEVIQYTEPSPTQFAEILGAISGKTLVINFNDLDKHPKCIDLLAEHVKKPNPGGRLIMVSRHWNSDNTVKERELRKFCLFYQQNLAPKRKGE